MTALVIGANGYLGSHVTRQLVTAGEDVRVMVRAGANTVGVDDLDVTRYEGDIWDNDTLRAAMTGADVVYYCVVDTRGWLRDPSPLFRTNVEGTRNVLDVAVEPEIASGLKKFVFTSSYATVGRKRGFVSTEDDIADERTLPPYVRSRVQAEKLVLEYARERGLPAVAMCVSTTYGGTDWGRTPHGAIIAGAAFGKLPFVMSGIELEAVDVNDAARALILAADKGRPGERYLISDKMISNSRGGADRRGRGGGAGAGQVAAAAGHLCARHDGHRQRPDQRHRRAHVAGVAAADARRGARRLQQGQGRIGLGAKAGRGRGAGRGAVLGGAA